MRPFTALALLLCVAACGRPQQTYSPEVELNFMRACDTRGSQRSYCTCVWDKIEAQISPQDFVALERLPLAEREASALLTRITGFKAECRMAAAALSPVQEPPPKP